MFAPLIEDLSNLIIPSICLYEIFKRIYQQRNEGDALQAVAVMTQAKLIELDTVLALNAAKLSLEHGLPMADSIILATARAYNALLWTQDGDFKGNNQRAFLIHNPLAQCSDLAYFKRRKSLDPIEAAFALFP